MSEVFDIESLFKGIDKEDIPNNRPHCRPKKDLVIMAGESTSHSFIIPFDMKEVVADCCVTYRLGLTNVLTKYFNEVELLDYDCCKQCSILTCNLSPEDTMLFENTLLDCDVQIKFIMKDGSTLFTEIYKVKLKDSLDVELDN